MYWPVLNVHDLHVILHDGRDPERGATVREALVPHSLLAWLLINWHGASHTRHLAGPPGISANHHHPHHRRRRRRCCRRQGLGQKRSPCCPPSAVKASPGLTKTVRAALACVAPLTISEGLRQRFPTPASQIPSHYRRFQRERRQNWLCWIRI